MFLKENLNPKGWKCGDCTVRACAKATGKTWEETFQDLCTIGLKKCRMPNDDCCIEKFLKDNGFEYHKTVKDVYGKPLSVEELADMYKEHILVVHTRRHLTAIVYGTIYDSWDTSRQKSGYFYIK